MMISQQGDARAGDHMTTKTGHYPAENVYVTRGEVVEALENYAIGGYDDGAVARVMAAINDGDLGRSNGERLDVRIGGLYVAQDDLDAIVWPGSEDEE